MEKEKRNTPRKKSCLNPCEMMYGGSTRTRLPKLGQPNPYRNPKREERKKSVKPIMTNQHMIDLNLSRTRMFSLKGNRW